MTATPQAIHAYLAERYPEPPPDLNWVTECHAALQSIGHAPTPSSVEEQYLCSDLSISSRPSARGRGIPTPDETSRHSGVIFAHPIVVQVHSVTDVGVSAYALKRTMEERRDVLSGATRIRSIDDDEEIDEGKIPPYSRAMLALEVSDGRTAMRAIEYRRIDGLVLAETPLGTKLRLHNVKCLKGTLLLTPDNTTILGGAVEAMEAEQGLNFLASLEARLEYVVPASFPDSCSLRNTRADISTARAEPPSATNGETAPRRRRTLPVRTARSAAVAALPPPPPPARRPSTQSSEAARAARRAALLAPDSDTSLIDESLDDSFIQEIEAVEAAATRPVRSTQSSRNTRSTRSTQATVRSRGQSTEEIEIIEISD